MKTKKKFGMRRHIGITAAATLIALGTTACEEAYWGGKDNRDIYKGLINNFNTENGHFDSTLNCKGSDNCFWNEMHDGCSVNAEDNIQNLKILLAPNIKSDASERLVVICSKWVDGEDSYELVMDPDKGNLKIGQKGITDNGSVIIDIDKYNDWLCKSDSDRKLGRLTCDEITYYLYDGNTKKYSKCDKGKCGDLAKEMPEAFKNAFNYRVCPDGYDYRAKYIGDLTNVCVKSVCNGVSINLYTDNDNCGTCGYTCSKGEGYTCVNGMCVSADKSKVLCKGEFINPENDPRYCGAKEGCKDFKNCEDDKQGRRLCSNGRCVSACVGNQILCNGRCVDPLTDNAYCGAKGTCTDDDKNQVNFKGELCSSPTPLCKDGVCSDTCSDGQIVCGGKCIDPLVDSTYCGAIGECNNESPEHIDFRGTQCKDGQVCVKGKCLQNSCSGDLTLCQVGNENKCVDINGADSSNCGKCGLSCDSSKPLHSTVVACELGICKYTCDEGYVNIGTGTTASSMQCVDLSNDNLNCGQIGRKCPTGNVCSNGDCRASCLERQVLCGTKCVDPSNDNKYCGAKLNGSCSSDNKEDDNYMGSECSGITPLCSGGKCVSTCVGNQIVCGGKCIDPSSDNRYCGAKEGCTAATECRGVTPLCSDGKCVSTCIGNQIVCGDRCVDPSSDNSYCGAKGACNNDSASSNDYKGATCTNGRVCSNEICALTCETGKIICDNKCVDPEADNTYCGAKGKCDATSDANSRGQKCADGEKCTDSVCKISCVSGQIACDGKCINLVATNVESCTSDKIQCKVGYENCDKEVANGCEVDTSNDNAHCGGCGNACTTAIVQNSASVQCSNRGCKATSCARGYVLKNGECEESNTLDCCGDKCTNCYNDNPNMKDGVCNPEESKCSVTSCKDGFMLDSTRTKCVAIECSNTRPCGNSGTCVDGKCKCGKKSACSGNTPICSDTKACVACTSETHCPSKLNYTATCKNNTCDYQCNTGYHEANNQCVKNTPENCGSDGKCKDDTPYCEENKGKCVKCTSKSHCSTNGTGVCDTDTNTCVYTTCSEGYTLSEKRDSCVPEVERCGSPATDCTKIANISNEQDAVSCENGWCKIAKCISNQYHPHNSSQGENQTAHDECKADSPNDCGSSHTKCTDQYPSEHFDSSCNAGTCVGTCKHGYTKCTDGKKVLCLQEGNGWGMGLMKPNWNATNCSNCVVVEDCSNGQFCNHNGGKPQYTCTNSK